MKRFINKTHQKKSVVITFYFEYINTIIVFSIYKNTVNTNTEINY